MVKGSVEMWCDDDDDDMSNTIFNDDICDNFFCYDDIDDDEKPEHMLGRDNWHLAQLTLLQRHLKTSL